MRRVKMAIGITALAVLSLYALGASLRVQDLEQALGLAEAENVALRAGLRRHEAFQRTVRACLPVPGGRLWIAGPGTGPYAEVGLVLDSLRGMGTHEGESVVTVVLGGEQVRIPPRRLWQLAKGQR